MKSIVLHDYFKFMEGGGRLCLILAQHLKADLAYGFKVADHPFFNEYRIHGNAFDLKVFGRLPGLRNLSLMHAFRRHTRFLDAYQAAVYSGFYAPMAVHNHPVGGNIYYCHTPPRYIYDQRLFYFSRYPVWLRPLISALIAFHQPRYEAAIKKMDCVVTNSLNVKSRIKTFLGVDAKVVYPPCETHTFQWISQGDFYLSAARLDPLKRVDRIVDAFKKMPDQRLVVISDGPQRKKIDAQAAGHDTIKVLGRVSGERYRRLLGECMATIYIPKDEDFGMTPIESMAAGKPVIGVREGGLKETIQHGETGILIPADPGIEDIVQAVSQLDRRKAKKMREACQARAKRFDVTVFTSHMTNLLNREF